MAPSQPNAPPFPPVLPAYPFQCISADFFHYKGKNYLVVADRYPSWPIIEQAEAGSKGLIDCLRRIFGTFGIPDECVTDGVPEFTPSATCQFLKDCWVHHRLLSVAHPHSNCKTEIGVKCVITNNTDPHGSLNTDALQRAILQYRNTPDPATKQSPVQCVFRRPIKDFIPIISTTYHGPPGVTLSQPEGKPLAGNEINFFFQGAIWLLNFPKWSSSIIQLQLHSICTCLCGAGVLLLAANVSQDGTGACPEKALAIIFPGMDYSELL